MDEIILLNRIRVDIGNVSGSLSDLLQYADMAGFNDNYEPQAKPRLVGTWTITDYYTPAQLAQAQATFDGLTIVGDPNYVLDFSQMAVQVLDPNEDNYNPAVAIVLQNKGLGTTMVNSPLGYGRWFLTKTQAANITTMTDNTSGGSKSWFGNVVNIADSNGIVSLNTTTTYTFSSFNEFKYFTSYLFENYSAFGGYGFANGCSSLEEITLPPQITSIGNYVFQGCSNLKTINTNNITSIGIRAFTGCAVLELSDISNVTSIGACAFDGCTKVTFTTINASVTNIAEDGNYLRTFGSTTSIPYLHFLSSTPITGIIANYNRPHIYCSFYRTTYKIYVGDGSSELHDKEILAAYKRASNLSGIVSYLYSWYEFAIPHVSYDGEYVTITVNRESTIYYTTDGTTPTTESMEYTEPFSWNGQGVIKIMATNSYNDTVYAKDFYSTTVNNPNITINTTTKQITLSSTTSDVAIYYTLDGSCPTLNSSVYSGPIYVTELGDIVKVRCFAVKEGMNDSNMVSKVCVMDDSLWGTDGDTSSFAVQCMDNTKPNYNPSVCIILDNNNKLTNKCYGCGGYISKTDAASITNSFMFLNQTVLIDSNSLVSNDATQSYDFETFNEFVYFTSYIFRDGNQQGEFYNCTNLTEITLPLHITSLDIGVQAGAPFQNCQSLVRVNNIENITALRQGTFGNCYSLKIDHLNDNVTTIPGGCFLRCTSLDMTRLPSSLTTIAKGGNSNNGAFNFSKLLITEIPANVTSMGGFRDIDIPYLHLLPTSPIDVSSTDSDFSRIGKFYVGDGSSAEHDNAIRDAYLADTSKGWSTYSSRLDTWYNYLHPTT